MADSKTSLEVVKKALRQEAKLGQILISQTSLTEEQLREALQIPERSGEAVSVRS